MNFEDALQILSNSTQLSTLLSTDINNYEVIDVLESDNRYSYENIYSNINVPNNRLSMRDGYAIKYYNIKNKINEFKVVNSIFTDTIIPTNEVTNETNLCYYITTGSIVPDEYDTIVMIEDIEKLKDNMIKISSLMINKINEKQWIRDIGNDIMKGELIISKNTKINNYMIGTLISIGIHNIKVIKNPKIAIFSTGNEIISNTNEYNDMKNTVFDINRPMLKLLLNKYNFGNVEDIGIIKDNYDKIKTTIDNLIINYDVIITTGGISMGEQDFIKKIMLEKNHILINKLNVKPGKPFLFSKINNCLIFNLPGNPVSTIVNFHMLLYPCLKNMLINNFKLPKLLNGYLINNLISDKSRLEFTRGIIYFSIKFNRLFVKVLQENDNSSNISQLNNFNCLIKTEINNKYNIGDLVQVYQINNIENYNNFDNVFKIGILTMSDRASQNIYEDISGNEIINYINNNIKSNFEYYYLLINDDESNIKKSINNYTKIIPCDLILTTGGTGPSFRDNTSKVTKELIDKELPGFGEIIRNKNFEYIPTSILSGQTAGVIYNEFNTTLIINLPGKPQAIKECLDIIIKSLPKYFQIMNSPDFKITNLH